MDIDFTGTAWESLYEAVDNEAFADEDAALIYNSIKSKFPVINFGDYLKRYIYQRAELEEPFAEVGLDVYQEIMKQSFQELMTPFYFEPTSEKAGAIIKRWLTSKTVKRKVVFLLGFGLNMSVKDVNHFLVKSLREHEINPKDPFEVICYYCYKKGFQYPKFSSLWSKYQEVEAFSLLQNFSDERTVIFQNNMKAISSDEELLAYVSCLKTLDGKTGMSVTARENFLKLYAQCKQVIADIYNADAGEERYSPEDISAGDFESIICSAIPKDRNGNLTQAKKSDLNEQFLGKRLSRQRINELLAEQSEINRFDLITLHFFLFSQKIDSYENVRKRYTAFVDDTNRILQECSWGELYIPNPYECFIMMCILSPDPLGTYADVWEMSFEESAEK